MFRKSCRLILVPAAFVAGTACNQPLTSTDIHEASMDEASARPRAHFSYMVDNAIAHDMSIADFHFVGHTSELSGTGTARLDRMASFLNTYGGTVRYETFLSDEELIRQRLGHVREYIALVGCDMERVEVTTMLSGGRGMTAKRAIEIDDRMAVPQNQEGSSGGGVVVTSGGGS